MNAPRKSIKIKTEMRLVDIAINDILESSTTPRHSGSFELVSQAR